MYSGSIDWRDAALMSGGAVTIVTAIIHGTLMGPRIIVPLERVLGDRMRGPARNLVKPLLHVSTVDWFLGGIALVATGLWIDGPGRGLVALLVGGQLLYAAACNALATRGRHPGWILMALALALTAAGASGAGS